MAVVTSFVPDDREVRSLHPTRVVCKYIISENNGHKIIQLNTYGSDDREIPGKLSQTLQLDEEAAKQLLSILSKDF